ncbi:hypothetical protein BC831DRAFT_440355 [Entophlyctis helioformis]|nr:hypothetical protein BC831DRAFT_440355 [Entophlyctis helioformis]
MHHHHYDRHQHHHQHSKSLLPNTLVMVDERVDPASLQQLQEPRDADMRSTSLPLSIAALSLIKHGADRNSRSSARSVSGRNMPGTSQADAASRESVSTLPGSDGGHGDGTDGRDGADGADGTCKDAVKDNVGPLTCRRAGRLPTRRAGNGIDDRLAAAVDRQVDRLIEAFQRGKQRGKSAGSAIRITSSGIAVVSKRVSIE